MKRKNPGKDPVEFLISYEHIFLYYQLKYKQSKKKRGVKYENSIRFPTPHMSILYPLRAKYLSKKELKQVKKGSHGDPVRISMCMGA